MGAVLRGPVQVGVLRSVPTLQARIAGCAPGMLLQMAAGATWEHPSGERPLKRQSF